MSAMVEQNKVRDIAGVGIRLDNKDVDRIGDALAQNREVVQEEAGAGEILEDLEEDRSTKSLELKQKFTEKKIRNLIRVPFELWYLKTGCEGVRIKPEEVDLILEDAVDIMNELVTINPLWLAAIGLAVNGGMIFTDKLDAAKKFKQEKLKRESEKGQS